VRRSITRRSSWSAAPHRGQRRSSANSPASGTVAQIVRPQVKHASRGMSPSYAIAVASNPPAKTDANSLTVSARIRRMGDDRLRQRRNDWFVSRQRLRGPL